MIKINAKLLAAVSIAQSTDRTRYYLNGVYFDKERIVATDGHIMTMAKSDDMELDETPTIRLISKSAMSAMKKTKADHVTIENDILTVVDDRGSSLFMEKVGPIDGVFPDYVRVCPQNTGEACLGTFLTPVIDKLVQTSKALSGNKSAQLTLTGNGRFDPHLVRYARDDIFSIAMPALRSNSIEMPSTYPAWFER